MLRYQNSALLSPPCAQTHGAPLFCVHFQCNTYGRWLAFSSWYRHQLCYSFLHKQPPRYKSTHSLPHCHSHRSQKHRIHNMVLDSPIKTPTELLSQLYLLLYILMKGLWISAIPGSFFSRTVCDSLGLSDRARMFYKRYFSIFTCLVDATLNLFFLICVLPFTIKYLSKHNFCRIKLPGFGLAQLYSACAF